MENELLAIHGATVSFDGFVVLNHLDLSIARGELRFLIGPNGAGKTTLLDMLSGKVRPDSGKVVYNGTIDITKYQEHELVHLGIGRKFQTPAVYSSLTVFENLEVAIGFRGRTLSLFGKLSGPARDRIGETLEKVGLQNRVAERAGFLSHGEQQWLEIAMLLVQDPTLLLLDEPVAGMTQREREQTGELLHVLESNHTIIVTEHDMDFVRRFSRAVTVLHMGKVIKEGTMEEVQKDQQVIEVYLGRGAVSEVAS